MIGDSRNRRLEPLHTPLLATQSLPAIELHHVDWYKWIDHKQREARMDKCSPWRRSANAHTCDRARGRMFLYGAAFFGACSE